MNFKTIILVGAVAVFSLANFRAVSSQPPKRPLHLRLTLADVRVGQVKKLYDPKEKYFLIGTGDCDGAHMSLYLVPEAELGRSWSAEWKKKIPHVTLPRLRSGTGVNIGESPTQVRRKLGKSPDYYSYDQPNKIRVYQYRASWFERDSTGKNEKILYRGDYKFCNEQLISIRYSVSEADGCD